MNAAIDLQRQFYDMLMRSQHWPAERLQEHQRGQLSQLLRHARATVPFYETRLDAVFRADGEIDWARWSELPILTREDLRDHREAMQARELPAGHGETQIVESSGSTGVPIATTQNRLAAFASYAAIGRAYRWHGIDCRRTLVSIFGEDPHEAAWPEGKHRRGWGPAFFPDNDGHQHEINLATTPEQALDFIVRHQPAYLNALASRIDVVAHEAIRQGVRIAVDTVMTFGERIDPSRRKLYRDVFGARVLPLYSAQETHAIAHACPAGEGFHVNAEMLLVEVLDDAGTPVHPGETGRVVVTPFYNTAQPLIRYDIGDLAVRGPVCGCGRTLPVLTDIVGRVAELFRLPEGGRVLPYVPEDAVAALNPQIWQIAQIGIDLVEFRYVPGAPSGSEAAFAAAMREALHPSFKLTMGRVEAIPRRGRKHVPHVCELPDA